MDAAISAASLLHRFPQDISDRGRMRVAAKREMGFDGAYYQRRVTAKLFGAQRLGLQAIQDAQGETSAYVEYNRIADSTGIALRDMRDWFLTLNQDGYVDLALTQGGLKASVTPQVRLALGLYRPFPSQPTPTPEPARLRRRTGRERGLVSGVSVYPPPIPKLRDSFADRTKSSGEQAPVFESIDQPKEKCN